MPGAKAYICFIIRWCHDAMLKKWLNTKENHMVMMRGGLICDKQWAGREGQGCESDIKRHTSNSSSTHEFIQTPTWHTMNQKLPCFCFLCWPCTTKALFSSLNHQELFFQPQQRHYWSIIWFMHPFWLHRHQTCCPPSVTCSHLENSTGCSPTRSGCCSPLTPHMNRASEALIGLE